MPPERRTASRPAAPPAPAVPDVPEGPDVPPAADRETSTRARRATRNAAPVSAPPSGSGPRRSTRPSGPSPRTVRSGHGQGDDAATLCIDVGGSHVKGATLDAGATVIGDVVSLPTTYPLPPAGLVDLIAKIAAQSAPAARISVGFPGMVRAGIVRSAPHYVTAHGPGSAKVPDLVKAWDHFALSDTLTSTLKLPCRLANDADTQGLAAIAGKDLELVVTLGTGFGTALFLDGELAPHLELAQHPLHKDKTYNDMVGDAARRKVGVKKWTDRVEEAIATVDALVFYDRLYIGGGNAGKLGKAFTREATIVDNADGIRGGFKLWSMHRVP